MAQKSPSSVLVGAQPLISDQDSKILKNLGYEVTVNIGSGRFGDVFRGVCNENATKSVAADQDDTTPGVYYDHIALSYKREISLNAKTFAMKRLRDSDQWTADLYNEVQTITDLDHPNIVEVYFVFKSPDSVYIIMEYLNGGTLKSLFNSFETSGKKMDQFFALRIIHDLTAGIQYLHNQDIVHGDLHNENVMLSVQNNVTVCKIVDFGHARITGIGTPMDDMHNLADHLTNVRHFTNLKKSIEANLRTAINMIRNGQFADMDEVADYLTNNLPPATRPPLNSYLTRFTKLFSKK